MRPAQQARGRAFAGIHLSAVDALRVLYLGDGTTRLESHRQLGTERFHRLLELLARAADRPDVEFTVVSETPGLEYISSQLPNKENDPV